MTQHDLLTRFRTVAASAPPECVPDDVREFLYEAASYTMQGTADPRALPLAIRRYLKARAALDKRSQAT